MAARNGSTKSAEILIHHGAEIEAFIKPRNAQADQLYPVHFAARHGHAECIEMLLKHGAKVNRQTGKSLMTALHLAVQHKHLACTNALLSYRASTEIADYNGNLPLHIACKGGDHGAIELLLQAGTKTDYFNIAGKRPYDLLNQPDAKAMLQRLSRYPKTLAFMCVQVIRASLHMEGCPKSLRQLSDELPVPTSVKSALSLNSVVQIVKPPCE
ncbi:predicted protein [Nematostella vectensis]|uniref:Uncharacterized protein n=2 Tax=Nematostella vectensis TaxID=45351 RepID=A7SNE2_NEMVE|nr:predicted protein [Nematostella vectensis]|eukprot:XP_001626884.1 predicted protein [Nematostella vectensis]